MMAGRLPLVILAGTLAAIAALGLLLLTSEDGRALNEEELRELGVHLLPQPREIEPFELIDENGEAFTRERLEGRWSFLFFGFTNCPDVCPVAMSALARVEQRLEQAGEQELHEAFHGVLVSVDPERDDPETLERYLAELSPRLTGVVGDRTTLAVLARELDVFFEQAPDGDGAEDYVVDHTSNIVIINPDGEYHGFVATPHRADDIERAYRSLAARY